MLEVFKKIIIIFFLLFPVSLFAIESNNSVYLDGNNIEKINFTKNSNQNNIYFFNHSSSNISLLSHNQLIFNILKNEDYKKDNFIISGNISLDAQNWMPSIGNKDNFYRYGKGFVSTNNIKFLNNFNNYISSLFIFSGYENNALSLSESFLILGNLNDYPFYLTLGKSKMPFGFIFGNSLKTNSLSKILFNLDSISNLSIGYFSNNFYNSISIFSADNFKFDYLYSLLFINSFKDIDYIFNINYINNINFISNNFCSSDSINIKNNQNARKRMAITTIESNLNWDIYHLYSGFMFATDFKNKRNPMKIAGSWYIKMSFSPNIYNKKTIFNISYNKSCNTVGISNKPNSIFNTGIINFNKNDNSIWEDFSINHMLSISFNREFIFDNIFFNAEYTYMNMWSKEKVSIATAGLSFHF